MCCISEDQVTSFELYFIVKIQRLLFRSSSSSYLTGAKKLYQEHGRQAADPLLAHMAYT